MAAPPLPFSSHHRPYPSVATWFALLAVACFFIPDAMAHKVSSASVVLEIETESDRFFRVSVAMEVESSGDAQIDDEIGPDEAARIFVEHNLHVLIDDQDQPKELTIEIVNQSDELTPEELQRLSVIVDWGGPLPPDGKELALFLDETSEMSVVLATVKNGVTARRMQVMFAGEFSRAENIEPLVEGNPFDKGKGDADQTDEGDDPRKESANDPGGEDSVLTSAYSAGLAGATTKMALPVIMFLALLVGGSQVRQLGSISGAFFVTLSIGFSLSAFAILPQVPWMGLACVLILFISATGSLASRLPPVSSLLAAIPTGFTLGNWLVFNGPFPELGRPPVDPLSACGFLAGVVSIHAAALIVAVLLTRLFPQQASFRNFVTIPLSIALAGIALFLLIEIL